MKAKGRRYNKITCNKSDIGGEMKVRDLLYYKLNGLLEVSIKDLIKYLLVILIVIAIGLIITNQFVNMFYKLQLIADPCTVCRNLNNNNIINWSNVIITP